jgi:hypothetical protein
MISSMLKPTVIRIRKRLRGNPDWGKFPRAIPALQTEFEKQVTRLGLAKSEYMYSAELKHWCDRNRNRVYVPEWLLKEWGMTIENIFSEPAYGKAESYNWHMPGACNGSKHRHL